MVVCLMAHLRGEPPHLLWAPEFFEFECTDFIAIPCESFFGPTVLCTLKKNCSMQGFVKNHIKCFIHTVGFHTSIHLVLAYWRLAIHKVNLILH